MCGICGFGGPLDLSENGLERMCEALVHRGPDDDGRFIEPGVVGLGFRRLSIIDLDHGNQPILNEDGRLAVTCNGEIYNFRELREELRAAGHEFRTGSDCEVIVHAYEESGDRFVERLQGMFAIALWDGVRRRLVLARDRLGVKPLYWARVGEGVLYGSEPGAILASGLVAPEMDNVALIDYLTLQYVSAPRSGFSGIQKLHPGERLVFEEGEIRTERWWRIPPPTPGRAPDWTAALDETDSLLRTATESRLVSDVPLGAFLSGGVDSSLVVSYMAELKSEVRTFSADFSLGEFSEGSYARRVAEVFGTRHTEFTVEPDMIPTVTEIVRYLGEPFADSSAIPTFLLSRLTREHVTVALSGDGGDEAFGGYLRYVIADQSRRLGPLSRAVGTLGQAMLPLVPPRHRARARRGFVTLARPERQRYSEMLSHFDPLAIAELCTADFLASAGDIDRAWRAMEPPLVPPDANRYMRVDLEHYLPGDILTKVDRMSMGNSLEVRSPLLDYRVQEYAAALPAGFKLSRGESKRLLKELAVARGVPREVVHRSKRGFAMPIGEWFRTDLRGWMEDILRDPGTRDRGIFRAEAVDRLVDEHVTGRRHHGPCLWNLVMLELWQRHWIDG
jgi:asparagine synthase (glutamine-hydrolysing)